MKTKHLLWIGAAVFVISLLFTAPVALLHAKLAPNAGGMQPVGLDGTLSDGSAASLLINGRPTVRNLHWRLRPLSLLLARAGFYVDGSGDLSFEGKAARLIGGGLNLDDLRAAGKLKSLLALIGNLPLPLDGQFGLVLDSARVRGGFPRSAAGELKLNNVQWTLSKDPLLLGDILAKIATEKNVIVARLEPVSGPLDLGGEIRLLADHSYEVDLQLKAKPTAEPLVQNLVRSLGQPDTQGFYHVRSRGQFSQPGQ